VVQETKEKEAAKEETAKEEKTSTEDTGLFQLPEDFKIP